jgi:hypothetical protein
MANFVSSKGTPPAAARQNKAEEVRPKIVAVAAAATAGDRRTVDDILAAASRGEYGSSIYDVTPGVGALLFTQHNPHNRDWDPSWSLELARRQRIHIWKKNNEPPGFYKDGALADAQHRFAAVALSGMTWPTVIIFGMDRDAITTVDAGRRRDAASALKMDGMHEAKLKQSIMKTAASYLTKMGRESAALRSEVEIADAIQTNNGVLETAIEIAQVSKENLVSAVLDLPSSAVVAYLMLTGGWPEQRVREKMALFQTGQSTAGDAEPFFITGQIIEKAHAKTDKRLSTVKEVGLVLQAMRLSAQGVRAVQRSKLLMGVKNTLPATDYPGEQQSFNEAAE